MEETAEGKLGARGESALRFTMSFGPRGQHLEGAQVLFPAEEVQSPGMTVTLAPCLSHILHF